MFTLFGIITLILTFLVLLLIKSLYFSSPVIPSNLKKVPGNPGIPLFGHLFSEKPLYQFLYKLGKKYSNGLFKFSMGTREIYVITKYAELNKAMRDKGNIFSGRWQNILVKNVIHDSGILNKDKEWWAVQRSFMLRVLRDFGFGKQRSQEIISNACNEIVDEIESKTGQVVSCRLLFPIYMVNIISLLAMNKKFTRNDEEFMKLTRTIETIAQKANYFVQLLLMYPILEEYSVLAKFLLYLSGRDQQNDSIHMFIKNIINEHRTKFNPDMEGEDVIDMYLLEQYKLTKEGVKEHTFTEWQIIRSTMELFIAGYETTSTTLSWTMIYLAKYPEIQDKLAEEIKEVIGTERMVTLNDKKNMPYTQAVMDEIFRVSTVVPLALPHRVLENTDVNGYFIPYNSIVFPHIYSIHRDPDTWEKPFGFYPNHFLKTYPDGTMKYEPKEELCPFGIGKRQCLGESLARMEFFMFLVVIIQRFKVKLPDYVSTEFFDKMTFGTDGTIRAALCTDVIFENRN